MNPFFKNDFAPIMYRTKSYQHAVAKSLEVLSPDFQLNHDLGEHNLQYEAKAKSIVTSLIFIHNRLVLTSYQQTNPTGHI